MIIRVDKCTTFGIKKFNLVAHQYEPKLYVNNEKIPPVEIDKSFKYLGHYFNFSMNDEMLKDDILSLVKDLMEKINILKGAPYKVQTLAIQVLCPLQSLLAFPNIRYLYHVGKRECGQCSTKLHSTLARSPN